jgi:acetyl-CoA C-acetyltransferase
MDPETNSKTAFVPQGIGADLIATLEGFSRADVDASRAELAPARGRRARRGPLRRLGGAGEPTSLGQTMLDEDEFIKPRTTMEGLASLKPGVRADGRHGLRRGGAAALPAGGAHPARAPRRQFVGHRRRRGAMLIGNEAAQGRTASSRARASRRRAVGADPTIMLTGPMPACRKALAKAGMTIDRSTCSRSTRPSPPCP